VTGIFYMNHKRRGVGEPDYKKDFLEKYECHTEGGIQGVRRTVLLRRTEDVAEREFGLTLHR